MIVRTCPECGHTNLRFSRSCGGCKRPLEPLHPRTGDLWPHVITATICLGLLAAAAYGIFNFLQQVQPAFSHLLFR